MKIVNLPNFVNHVAHNKNAKAVYLLSSADRIEDASDPKRRHCLSGAMTGSKHDGEVDLGSANDKICHVQNREKKRNW